MMLGISLSLMFLLIINCRYLQSLEKEVQALRNQPSSASPAHTSSNGDEQTGPVPNDMPSLARSHPVVMGAQPADSQQHDLRQREQFLPHNPHLGNRKLADQTLGEVHLPGELVIALIEGYEDSTLS